MDDMTLKETAEKLGMTPRRVNDYCAGWVYLWNCENDWYVAHSKSAGKPTDRRYRSAKGIEK